MCGFDREAELNRTVLKQEGNKANGGEKYRGDAKGSLMATSNSRGYAVPVATYSLGFASQNRYVKHDYRDHYHDPPYHPIENELEPREGVRRGPRGGVVTAFPERLYAMLNEAEHQFPDIVGWQPHGRSFLVRQPKRFVAEFLPK